MLKPCIYTPFTTSKYVFQNHENPKSPTERQGHGLIEQHGEVDRSQIFEVAATVAQRL